MSHSLGSYPPGTWAGDPSAPWNEEEPPPCCGDCDRYCPLGTDETHGICELRARGHSLRRAADVAAVRSDDDACDGFR